MTALLRDVMDFSSLLNTLEVQANQPITVCFRAAAVFLLWRDLFLLGDKGLGMWKGEICRPLSTESVRWLLHAFINFYMFQRS